MGLFPRSESFEQFFLPLVESEMCKVIVAYLALDINFLTLSFCWDFEIYLNSNFYHFSYTSYLQILKPKSFPF
jgi:hypothetical protein